MINKKLLAGKWMPAAALCAALTFSPFTLQGAYADVLNVQQQQNLKGTVVDNAGEPVIGASVVVVGVKGTGTVTDIDGNFTLKVKPGTKLQISFVGYQTQVVVAKEGMKVTLSEDNNMLEEVQIVAYGAQKKVTVTGAVSSVKSEDLVRTSVGSVNNVLGGQLSGVTTVQYSGEPGSDAADIFVRGKATWEDATPLIQVDGVERSTIADIDPNEIESITVLKDASATAVFGVRGANGVILITTKRGQEGRAKISISTSFTALTPTKMVEQASSLDYALFYNQMRANDGLPQYFSDEVIQKFRDNSNPIAFPNTKWAEYIMKDVTLQQQHNLNISGGTDKVKYFVSAGFYSQDGMFKEFDLPYNISFQYQRFNYRSNLDLKATKTTNVSFNIAGSVSYQDKPYSGVSSGNQASNLINTAYTSPTFTSPGIVNGRLIMNTASFVDADGVSLPFGSEKGSTGMGYYGNGFRNNSVNKLEMSLSVDQKLDFITKGLSFKLKGAYNSSYTIEKSGSASVATYTPFLDAEGNIVYSKSGQDTEPTYGYSQGKGRDWYYEGSFNYSRSFGKHSVTGLLLYNQSKTYYLSTYSDIPRGYVGLVGRATYDWNNRYMVEFNIGYNGSENFHPDKRFGTFPAGSVGWVVSDESFWKPLSKVISFFKLRASWGLVGNDKIPRFQYLADQYIINSSGTVTNGYTNANDRFAYNFGNAGTSADVASMKGAHELAKNNPNVGWETAFKQDYGFDVRFLDNKLNASFDYYREHRTDILVLDGTMPSIIGFTAPRINSGETKSWGWEASISLNNTIGKNFRYWTKLNISYNQNEVVEMKEEPKVNAYQYQKGHRIGSRQQYKFWKYYYNGCEADYQAEFGTPFPVQKISDLKPGDCVYVDLDGNGVIDENDMSRELGYTDDPEYMAGLTFGFAWKRLTFNAQFTGAWNVSRVIGGVFARPFQCNANSDFGGLLQYHVDNTWTPGVNESQSAEYPRASWASAEQNYIGSDLYEKDSKYLRLKTISIGYDFNNRWLKGIGFSKFELTLSAYNLFTITPYKWGDPEARASTQPSYPLQRTYTASLNIGF